MSTNVLEPVLNIEGVRESLRFLDTVNSDLEGEFEREPWADNEFMVSV